MPGSWASICFVRRPFIGRFTIRGLRISQIAAKSSGRSDLTNWSPPETVTHVGTPAIDRKIFRYSSTLRSATFFCQMSHVLHRDVQV